MKPISRWALPAACAALLAWAAAAAQAQDPAASPRFPSTAKRTTQPIAAPNAPPTSEDALRDPQRYNYVLHCSGCHFLHGEGMPSGACIQANVHALARYAALCQEQGLVPMVEPEVLMDGSHGIEDCFEVTEATLRSLYAELYEQDVLLEGSILKASMVLAGKDCAEQADVDEVAEETVRCLKSAVPSSVPGIVFLSGGQSDEQATAHLNAMNKRGALPWPLSFSYGRAMQTAALKLWSKDLDGNFAAAQQIVAQRARENGLAAMGKWRRG